MKYISVLVLLFVGLHAFSQTQPRYISNRNEIAVAQGASRTDSLQQSPDDTLSQARMVKYGTNKPAIAIKNGKAYIYNPALKYWLLYVPDAANSVSGTNVVTNSNMAQLPANTLKGNNTGSTGNVLDLTTAQVKAMLAVDQVNNTSDANKPVSIATQTALDAKQNKLIPVGSFKISHDSASIDSEPLSNVLTGTNTATQAITGDSRQNELYATGVTTNTQIANPTGTATVGNKILVSVRASATISVTLGSAYTLGSSLTLPSSIASGQEIIIAAICTAAGSPGTWRIVYIDTF